MPRNNSVWPRCRGAVASADLIRFQGRRMGRDIPGRKVRRASAAARVAGASLFALDVTLSFR
jgi:hypothetical protein